MTRTIIIMAGPSLAASLSEQAESLGALRQLPPGEAPAAPWPDAILLDADFCDAAALAEKIRGDGFDGALIVVAGADATIPEADAALRRPFRLAELIDALQAPSPRPRDEDGASLRLTEKEAAIVRRLVDAGGEAISKTDLLADVWGYGPNVSTRTLETHIHRLRRKLAAEPGRPRKLLTDERGYRLVNLVAEAPFQLPASQKTDKTSA